MYASGGTPFLWGVRTSTSVKFWYFEQPLAASLPETVAAAWVLTRCSVIRPILTWLEAPLQTYRLVSLRDSRCTSPLGFGSEADLTEALNRLRDGRGEYIVAGPGWIGFCVNLTPETAANWARLVAEAKCRAVRRQGIAT